MLIAGAALRGYPRHVLVIPLTVFIKHILDLIESLKSWGYQLSDTMPPLVEIILDIEEIVKKLPRNKLRTIDKMKRIYRHSEMVFEKITTTFTTVLGNSITFILALAMVVFWLVNKEFYMQDVRDIIRDIIHGITFLSLFIIQKSFSRFSVLLHLKVNELVSSHKPASNTVLNVEDKTEHDLIKLSKEYTEPKV